MSRGICHRCWREWELVHEHSLGRSCFRKIPSHPNHIIHHTFPQDNLSEARFWRSQYIPHIALPEQKLNFNFLPIHVHYDLTGSLAWAEKKISELDLAINIMTLAYPPTKKYGEISSVKLAGGSIVSEDIWIWHCFFAAKFIEPIPYEGGSINLQEARDWIMKMNSSRKGEFPIGKN